MIKAFKILFVSLLFQFLVPSAHSQDLLNNRNISQIQVDQISDADIMKFQAQLKASNLSITEAQQIAIARGMPASEVAKLRVRLDALNQFNTSDTSIVKTPNGPTGRNVVPTNAQIVNNNTLINSKIFGAELFTTTSLSFEPNLKLATPLNYILGADDALQISVYGLQETNITQTVTPEGAISIPTVGVIKVGGLTIEQATALIKSKMASVGYRSLRTGASKISVTLTKIRSISITIVGAVKSGTYTISSLATLFNALFLSGGPGQNRSFRRIELIRSNKIFRTVDLYKFLTQGDESDNVSLKDNDIIRLPIYDTRVEIEGEVKRPGIFEILPDEKLTDLIKFTGGFSDSAYRASIKVVQLTSKEKKVKDIEETEFVNYHPHSGDHFNVSKILNRYENRVTIVGAVFRPGSFERTENLTVSQLIKNAEGLKEDAFTQRGQLVRTKSDNTKEIISFDINKALSNPGSDIVLRREDSVIISSIFDLKEYYTLTIQGEVRKPNIYQFIEGMTLKDLIVEAGGFTYAAYPQRIEIARLLKRNVITSSDKRLSEIITIDDVSNLSIDNKNQILQPFDVITIRKLAGFVLPQSVSVAGQIQFPGPYVLSNQSERVSDLVKRAGGFLPGAYPAGAYIRRSKILDSNKLIEQTRVQSIQKQMKDSSNEVVNSFARSFDQIPLDLNSILTNYNSEYNLVLKEGDELYIPKNDQEIVISGEVYFPTQSPYLEKSKLRDYISTAGGFTEGARKKRIYVLYPNGKAEGTHHFLFFKKYPRVLPGGEIIVPKATTKRKLNTVETIGISSALASLAGVVIAIIQLTKK